MTDRFTIAHFTDAHLPCHGRLRPSELIGKRALSAANWALSRRRRHAMAVADALKRDILAHRPDHVAMTGDAVNFGLAREFAAAAAWLRDFGAPEDLSYVPGNHESLQAGEEAVLASAFAPFSAAAPADWPWLRRRGPVTLIGVTTSTPTPPGYAQGEAGGAQIARLRARLAETSGLFRVVLIHHPPTELSKPRKALRDRRAVVAAIAEAGAELVLHGHNHRNELSWIDDRAGRRVPVLGAPSASTPPTFAAPAEWRALTVATGDAGWRLEIERRAVREKDGGLAFETCGRFAIDVERPAADVGRG